MARIELITERAQTVTDAQREAFDWVVESRGKMLRPFEVLLHAPGVGRSIAELGARIRFESSLTDHDRELVVLATAAHHGCDFEWNSHLPLARKAGVRPAVIDHLAGNVGAPLEDREMLLLGFVSELCSTSTVSLERFDAVRVYLGDAAVVELCATIGYYTLLGFVMGACDAC